MLSYFSYSILYLVDGTYGCTMQSKHSVSSGCQKVQLASFQRNCNACSSVDNYAAKQASSGERDLPSYKSFPAIVAGLNQVRDTARNC